MKHIVRTALPLLALVTLAATGLAAQTMAQAAPPASDTPGNPAVSTSSENTGKMPVKGANSFTEDQARSHIEAKGYSKVTDLKVDPDGIWRGKASKGTQIQDVALDFQGNVFGK